ncbi:MAG: MarR family winged helix-turn-helix transcriptional regulator [Methylophilaceae bacterium]|nr:MarR family transcriptional regulator [Methyloradius sp.]
MPSMLIAHSARMLARKADIKLREIGISTSQFPVLVALKNGGTLTQKELAQLANVEQPSMAQLLSRMERDGLIRRETDPNDGRSSLISLSEKAVGLITPVRAILSQGNEDALAGFNEADIEQLVVLLQRLLNNVSDGKC